MHALSGTVFGRRNLKSCSCFLRQKQIAISRYIIRYIRHLVPGKLYLLKRRSPVLRMIHHIVPASRSRVKNPQPPALFFIQIEIPALVRPVHIAGTNLL